MRVLIPNLRHTGRFLMEAAEGMGYEVIGVINAASDSQRIALYKEFARPGRTLIDMKSRFETGLDHAGYGSFLEKTFESIYQTTPYQMILPVPAMEGMLQPVANINKRFHLPGIIPATADLYTDKIDYTRAFAEIGLTVPKVFQVLEPEDRVDFTAIELPCVCKPAFGSAGYGVYVAHTTAELIQFFESEGQPEKFSDISRFYQGRNSRGLRHHLHYDNGGRYMIQEYLEGPTISVAGNISDSHVTVDYVYETLTNAAPYRAEQMFLYPMPLHETVDPPFSEVQDRLREMIMHIDQYLGIPNGPYMMDLVEDNGVFHIVDFAPRTNSVAVELMEHSHPGGSIEYAQNTIRALQGHTITEMTLGTPVAWGYFVLPSGIVQEVPGTVPEDMLEVHYPEVGTHLYEPRNDTQVATRGYAVTTGTTPFDAFAKLSYFLDTVEIKVTE